METHTHTPCPPVTPLYSQLETGRPSAPDWLQPQGTVGVVVHVTEQLPAEEAQPPTVSSKYGSLDSSVCPQVAAAPLAGWND